MGAGAQPGERRGGRGKGTLNVRTRLAAQADDIAKKLGVDPFEILLKFAAADWKALGYKSETETRYSAEGSGYEVYVIEPQQRIIAAKAACEYLFPKRKSVEVTAADGKDFFQSFAELAKQVVDAK